MGAWAIILAAGKGSRMQQAGLPVAKQFVDVEGVPLFWLSAQVLMHIPAIEGFVFVFPPYEEGAEHTLSKYTQLVDELALQDHCPLPHLCVAGGAERQDSVWQGILSLPANCMQVLVHDAARPFITASLVQRVLMGLEQGHAGVIPAIEVADTIKQVDDAGMVLATFDRSSLRAVQTPQGFALPALRHAHEQASLFGWQVTDDASLLEQCGYAVHTVAGDAGNKKITYKEDLAVLDTCAASKGFPCTGFGYDVHKYGGIRPFILGGVPIQTDVTVEAHSDGDVVLHALVDAILGCIGGGDIGDLFPDTAAAFDNIASGILLAEVWEKSIRAGLTIHHVDITIVAQVPKIGPHKQAIGRNIAKMLSLPAYAVNVKATTEEKLGFTGEKKGIKAMAVVTGTRVMPHE